MQYILNPHDILKYSRIKATYLHPIINKAKKKKKTRLSEISISNIFLSLHFGGHQALA